ncbi:bifunctional diaminohydroxyphosphoribosylaminopyrimidine deaminase/5-amino-6-(5-phosphoribosylamino)uracil reductase RibD [Flavobacterium sp.]|uniref:bifunctional diaminohydroxyphosphoribosylaminopyrimidine deaminase/5-amino-6-(5-phosphoribosylamino)uracil reductase RibD n=1 Tax=Flavobacterium sp. TaxID=239 RepID=UPI0035294D11
MEHEKYMQRCLELAEKGFGNTYPNPMVGCVIVYKNTIIGEGWHQKAGEPHAEVNAINAVKDKSLLAQSTIYVSLEPCNHYGKTPPCSDLIVHHKIPNVVVGMVDPNEKVAGKGIEKLRQSGANVTVGILESQCLALNKRFITFHNKKRPYLILKWAESADGFLAPSIKQEQKPVWITNAYSRQLVHKWRTEEQAILVGTTTVLADNPRLDSRDWKGNNPIRIVLDRTGKITPDFEVKNGKQPTIFITEKENFITTENCIAETIIFDSHLAENSCKILFEKGIQSVIIEGGLQTLQTFIDADLWDEARIFKGDLVFQQGTKAPSLFGKTVKRTTIVNDELLILKRYD